MIAIIDYGVANLGSMCNMLRRIGVDPVLAATPEAVLAASKLILPGIGAFDHGMGALNERGLAEALRNRVLNDGVPILGVCLGFQLLGQSSEEGTSTGLGLIDSRSVRFSASVDIRVPHMGWCHLRFAQDGPLLAGLDREARFYFVHSYHMVCSVPTDVLATAQYGSDFTAMIQRDNIYGAQFHPEKSHRFGMRLLRNFAEL